MTQKEYKEEINKYKELLKKAEDRLQEELNKNYKYEQVLENYYIAKEDLRKEKEYNVLNCQSINEKNSIIERYEKILDKFTINYN